MTQKILIASPLPLAAVGGPATVARELSAAYTAAGDHVTLITLSPLEKRLPIGIRQGVLLVRAIPQVAWADAVLILDPATTGPAIALLARLFRKRSVLRIGGDFLWETYVNRTRTPVRLSEFYTMPRALTMRERFIRAATSFTLRHVDHVVFTTAWQKRIWERPYGLTQYATSVIANAIPPATETSFDATKKIFLAASRGPYLKNHELLERLWPRISAAHPEAVLDATPRSPEDYHQALASCYALLLPSISDVSPNVVLEAIALGKPFVATEDTGLYETYGDLGGFVDTRSDVAVLDAITRLLDPVAYEDMRARIHTLRVTRSWSTVAEEFKSALTLPRTT